MRNGEFNSFLSCGVAAVSLYDAGIFSAADSYGRHAIVKYDEQALL